MPPGRRDIASGPGAASGALQAALRTERSEELFRAALSLIPGGVNSPVRAMRAVGRDPVFIASGEGAHLVDVDGNRYLDYVCSWGPLIAGHAHPEVVAAVCGLAGDDRATLYSSTEFKKVRLLYFTPDYAAWEARYS